MVWRRLRIAADTSLAALHFIFQIVQGWGDDHLHQFHIYGKDYGISYEGGIGFVDNPFRVVIDDFAFDAGDALPMNTISLSTGFMTFVLRPFMKTLR
ncbi:PRiA4b ORF-3-like protein [Escherichia coli]|nr:PRiA4b ORF-3-like protein [Escherichia coli]